MSAQKFTACLLAGGKSSRMGRDKAGVEFRGTPLWQHQLETLRQTGAEEILISGRSDASHATADVRIIKDEIKGCGPLSGICALLRVAAHPLVLVLAVDMPLMKDEYLRSMAAMACGTGAGVVPAQNGRFEGLAAIYPVSALELAETTLQGEDFSLQHFIAECVTRKLILPLQIRDDEAFLFQNMNTPADLVCASLPVTPHS